MAEESGTEEVQEGWTCAGLAAGYFYMMGVVALMLGLVSCAMNHGGGDDTRCFLICILTGMGLAHRVEAFRMLTVFLSGLAVLAGLAGAIMALTGVGGMEPECLPWAVLVLVTSAIPIFLLLNRKADAEFKAGPI